MAETVATARPVTVRCRVCSMMNRVDVARVRAGPRHVGIADLGTLEALVGRR